MPEPQARSTERVADLAETTARAHRELVHASVAALGARHIAESLVGSIGGWVLLLSDIGDLHAAIPESARAHLGLVQAEVPRLATFAQNSTISINMPDQTVSVRSLRIPGQTRGVLALGRSTPLTGIELSLVDTSVYLLSEHARRTDEARREARNNRRAILELMLNGHSEIAREMSQILHVPIPDGALRIAILGVPRRYGHELLEIAEEDPALRRIDTVIAERGSGRIGILLPSAEGDLRTLQTILRQVPYGRGSVSDPVDAVELPDSVRRVERVFNAAPDVPGKLHEVKDISEAGLLKHLRGYEVRAWAQETLAMVRKLDQSSKVDFTRTLRVYLANNGQADASAGELGIHRHTLRYRMTRVCEALGRDLDDPTVRAELWFALQLYPNE